MILTHEQSRKLRAIEYWRLDEVIRIDALRYAFREEKSIDDFDGDVLAYMEALGKLDGPPFFNLVCCTKMIDQVTVENKDNSFSMTWKLEWDAQQIEAFKDGCAWANEHGAGIPM